MTLYETIFVRRAVRKYDMTPLDEKTLGEIRKWIDETQQLPGQNARFEIVSADKVKGTAAPHYIMCYCKPADAEYANVGYVIEKADLYMQSLGLGSLWLGMGNPKAKQDDFCIMLAFGKSDVPFRTGEQEFNRLPVCEISNTDNPIAQAARLAPVRNEYTAMEAGFCGWRCNGALFWPWGDENDTENKNESGGYRYCGPPYCHCSGA